MKFDLSYLKRLFPHTWIFEHDQEIEYRLEYSRSSLRQVRAGAILGLIMLDTFYLYDVAFMPTENLSALFWIRFGFLSPVIILWFWRSILKNEKSQLMGRANKVKKVIKKEEFYWTR